MLNYIHFDTLHYIYYENNKLNSKLALKCKSRPFKNK